MSSFAGISRQEHSLRKLAMLPVKALAQSQNLGVPSSFCTPPTSFT
jgi:hypothetical protein